MIVVVGQDGLVANVAKYLDGQPVVGIDPEPGRNAGVLVTHAAGDVGELVRATDHVAERTMVEARLDDGQHLLALNEIFLGHPSHQTARYDLFRARGRWRGTGILGRDRRVPAPARPAGAAPWPSNAAVHFACRRRASRDSSGSCARHGPRPPPGPR